MKWKKTLYYQDNNQYYPKTPRYSQQAQNIYISDVISGTILPPPVIDLFGIALKGGILWFKGKLTEYNAASRISLELTKLGIIAKFC